MRHRFTRKSVLLVGVLATLTMSNPAMAQPSLDRLLSSAEVRTAGGCSTIDIVLNHPVTFAGRFPSGTGTELSIRLDVLGTSQAGAGAIVRRESASVMAGNDAGLLSVTLVPTGGVPALLLTFKRPVRFAVSRDSDARHIVVTASEASAPATCGTPQKSMAGAPGDLNKETLGEAKKSLTAKDYSRAVALFTKAAASGDPETRREAQELLGLARERAGQLAHARAEYEAYLKSYPQGPDAERVRQRLAGVMAAIESDANAAFAARKKTQLERRNGLDKLRVPKPSLTPDAGGKGDLPPAKGWQWQTSGSAGQFYYRNDGFDGMGLLRGTLGTHDLHQNDIVSSADVTVYGENGVSEIKTRLSTYNQTGIGDAGGEDRTNISAAYVEMRNRLNGLSARLGRQHGQGRGVFGRFDGALLGLELNDAVTLHAIAGSPVYYGSSEPFADGRYFAGGSIDLTSANRVWAGTFYAIEQHVHDTVDRRAIGAELRYAKDSLTGYAAADYDIHFNEFNNAYASGSWAATDDFSVFATLDYRHVPFLLTSNALIGQSTGSLSSLVDLFGSHETELLAIDRTASAFSATAGFSYDISESWQFSLEGSIADYSGTPASGGIDEIPDPGMEYYLSAQLDGTGVFTENDYVGAGLRFLDNESDRSYIADFSLRYPVNEKLRLSPRLRLAYRDRKDADLRQILITPSIGLKYQLSDHWNFESDIAARWEDGRGSSGHDQNGELLFTAGYRYQF